MPEPAHLPLTGPSGHMAWCGLVALRLAIQDNPGMADAQANLFLTRWLSAAQKQRRFSRAVAPDLEWLLKQGRTLGVKAGLPEKLAYLWRSCTGELAEQNDLFRLTYALETAKTRCWNRRLLNMREWTGRHAVPLNDNVNCIYLLRSSLDQAFDKDGRQISPLMMKLTGRVDGFLTLLERCGWSAQADGSQSALYRLLVMPKTGQGHL
jgi:hypothetical protein